MQKRILLQGVPSYDFLVFFPLVTAVYFVLPRRRRTGWLLAASYYFYICWNPRYALLIAFSTLVAYSSRLAGNFQDSFIGKAAAEGVVQADNAVLLLCQGKAGKKLESSVIRSVERNLFRGFENRRVL